MTARWRHLVANLAILLGYQVCQAGEPGCIYQTDGTTDDWAYGELGIAAYTFELGTEFFQQCTYFETSIVEDSIAALLYAAKSAQRPYQLPAGPETLAISTTVTNLLSITATDILTDINSILHVTATADDTRYASNGWGIEPNPNHQHCPFDDQPCQCAHGYPSLHNECD